MTWLLLFSCSCRAPVIQTQTYIKPSDPSNEEIQSGSIDGNHYSDNDYNFTITFPSDWSGKSGSQSDALRLRLAHRSRDLSIEFWRFQGSYSELVERENCRWSFNDQGYYQKYSSDSVLVATCESDTQDNLIFGLLNSSPTESWQIEIHTGSNMLVDNRRLAEDVILSASLFKNAGLSSQEDTKE